MCDSELLEPATPGTVLQLQIQALAKVSSAERPQPQPLAEAPTTYGSDPTPPSYSVYTGNWVLRQTNWKI